jgi:hypothetical protein
VLTLVTRLLNLKMMSNFYDPRPPIRKSEAAH